MANLKEVKNRIQTVNSTQQITKAMKMVAAAKLRRAQDRIIQMRPYAEKLNRILQNLSASTQIEGGNAFAKSREVQKVLIIAITSDRGLCGGFNSNIFKATEKAIDENFQEQKAAGNLTVMPIGKKALDYFNKRDFQTINDFGLVFHDLTFDIVKPAAELAMEGFLNETYDVVHIVYNEFKNVATQIVHSDQFLPILESKTLEAEKATDTDYIYEPDEETIVKELIPKSLKISFYAALLESFASEQGARMTAMDKATDNANELLKELKLSYNRSRQAAITNEILEIVGGAEALSNG